MYKATFSLLLLSAICRESSPEPQSHQFHPSGYHQEQPPRVAPHPQTHGFTQTRHWTQSLHNYSATAPNFDFLDPASSPVGEEILKTKVPRQSGYYGPPQYPYPGFDGRNQNPIPPPQPPQPPVQPSGYPGGFSQGSSQGYPQIYKVDNLIIIANPPQQQSCMQPSNVRPLNFNSFPETEVPAGLENRFGDSQELSKCTWAIITCCAPGSIAVRYNCFELLGCEGMFVDQLPCNPAIVEGATRAALAFYRNSEANSTTSTDNRV